MIGHLGPDVLGPAWDEELQHALDHPGQVTTGDTHRGHTHWVYSRAERPTRPGLRRGLNQESFGSRTRRLSGSPDYSRGR